MHLNQTSAPATALERQALAQVGLAFNDRVHIAAAAPTVTVDRPPETPILTVLGVPHLEGDVYPDRKQYLDAVLAKRLPLYDVLVVGSGVDHNTMSANAVKEAVRDWVLAGGSLVVLGSGQQGYQWLQPLFSTGVSTVNDLAIDADASHPLLNEPNGLAWQGYDSHGRGWDVDESDSDAFNHVVLQDGQDVLTVSKDGAFGAGRILLTTYLPREIAANQGIQEASHFFENIALFADRSHLYLDYGPTLPQGVPVTIAIRQSWLHDDRLGDVPVRVEVAWVSA